ncbi:MAG: sugar ABC transporter permease [Planctomycetota bacterium]
MRSHAMLRENAMGWLWISPWIVGFLAFLLVPMVLSFYYSFTDYPLMEPPLWVGMGNYLRMFGDDKFISSAGRTLVYAALAVPLSTVVALVIAGLLSTRVRLAGIYQAAVFIPTLVPMAASGMVWLWLFNAQYGFINLLLAKVGIQGPGWFTDARPAWSMASILIVGLWGVGQAVVVYVAAMHEVPGSLYEAADLDGMGPVRKFLNVTLPMISPVILLNVVTLLIGAVQLFTVPFIVRAATPGGQTSTMTFYSVYMFDNAFVYGQMGYACAMAWVQLVVVLILTGLTFLASKKLVHYRGA